ncbi:MAG: hypothetical protein P4N59_21415 [Negativicutes bacterium]|nr:hypothetical protein [Negativicutes bacterium]
MDRTTRIMTEEQRTAYLKSGGDRCPYCGDAEITNLGDPRVGNKVIMQRVYCTCCEISWFDVYTLSDCRSIIRRDAETE